MWRQRVQPFPHTCTHWHTYLPVQWCPPFRWLRSNFGDCNNGICHVKVESNPDKELLLFYWSLLYSAFLCSRADALRSCCMWFWFKNNFNIHRYLQLYLVVIWCHVKLLPSWRTFCAHPYNHAPVYSVTSFKATYARFACVFSCNLPPALLAEWPGSFTCYCGNTWVKPVSYTHLTLPTRMVV